MSDNKIKLNITGMTCSGCAATVKNALLTVPEVNEVETDLSNNTAVVTYTGKTLVSDELINAVQQAGYEASLSN